jgi:hypothetical protein
MLPFLCSHRPLQVPWREYVPVAWQVDPCLALTLLDHFPASSLTVAPDRSALCFARCVAGAVARVRACGLAGRPLPGSEPAGPLPGI